MVSKVLASYFPDKICIKRQPFKLLIHGSLFFIYACVPPFFVAIYVWERDHHYIVITKIMKTSKMRSFFILLWPKGGSGNVTFGIVSLKQQSSGQS